MMCNRCTTPIEATQSICVFEQQFYHMACYALLQIPHPYAWEGVKCTACTTMLERHDVVTVEGPHFYHFACYRFAVVQLKTAWKKLENAVHDMRRALFQEKDV